VPEFVVSDERDPLKNMSKWANRSLPVTARLRSKFFITLGGAQGPRKRLGLIGTLKYNPQRYSKADQINLVPRM
jgi:hypothetical protein